MSSQPRTSSVEPGSINDKYVWLLPGIEEKGNEPHDHVTFVEDEEYP